MFFVVNLNGKVSSRFLSIRVRLLNIALMFKFNRKKLRKFYSFKVNNF